MEEQVKILIVDDHQMFIDGVKSLLRKEKKYHFVAEALSGKQALEILEKKDVELIITDISMPEMSGLELTKTVKEKYPHIKVLVVSMNGDKEIAEEIMLSEAEGYILKNTGKAELVSAMEALTNGSTFYSREILTTLMQKVKKEKKIEREIVNLTKREIEVLQLICQEYTSDEIAEKLYISRRTVDTHRQNIYEKTGCKTIVSLIKFAIRNELVDL